MQRRTISTLIVLATVIGGGVSGIAWGRGFGGFHGGGGFGGGAGGALAGGADLEEAGLGVVWAGGAGVWGEGALAAVGVLAGGSEG